MSIGLNEILIACGAILTTWVLNNGKLKEGITEWTIARLGIDTYNIDNHSVKETLKALKFEARLTEFDNAIKTELYHYYVEMVLNTMNELVLDILSKQSKLGLEETKRLIKNTMYDRLSQVNSQVDARIKMPSVLQSKFDKIRNYLTMQHTHAIDNALQSANKKLLMVQVFDAIDNNSRWFLFYVSEMFENFNGHFDNLSHRDVFLKRD